MLRNYAFTPAYASPGSFPFSIRQWDSLIVAAKFGLYLASAGAYFENGANSATGTKRP